MKKNVLCWIVCVSLCACSERNTLSIALEKAGDNRMELLKVIDHYQNVDNKNSGKLEAARFLIENMPEHGTVWSEAIDSFRQQVALSDSLVDMKVMNAWWDKLAENDKPVMKADVKHLKADFLIKEIDKAFETWQSVPWKEDVNFELFCRYVLPYRFSTELLLEGWRDSLYNAYFPLVKDAKTTKEAFEIVHDTVWKRLLSSSSHFPYIIDVVAMQHQRKAMCMQRCVALGAVMRALCIPAAIDHVGHWANYSKNSHAWAALITEEGTYSIYEEEWEAKINNRIDASRFDVNYKIAEDYPLATDFQKRCYKLWRNTYERYEHTVTLDSEWKVLKELTNPFSIDVSVEYGLKREAEIRTGKAVNYAYLCSYLTGSGWKPFCYRELKNGKCKFDALGDSVLYLPMGVENGKVTVLEPPFLLLNHRKTVLIADTFHTRTVRLDRKYPLTGKWMNEWAPMTGGRFEGSNDADFKQTDCLARIETMPVFRNVATIQSEKEYRYVRYVSEAACDTPMAEVEIWNDNEKLHVVPGKSSVGEVEKSLDGNTLTRPKIEAGYSLGYDLGIPQKISSIVYFPWNDDNFVLPGHDYELFYFADSWVSLGKQTAQDYELVYENVPDNALLFLKDHTAGSEERPFTYENGKQIWW